MTNKLKIIISGGGTGGHIYPAIAVAQEFEKRFGNQVEFLFVGAKDRMEMEKVPKAGYKIEGLWISGLQRSLTTKNLLFPFKVISSVYNSLKIINRFEPNLAIGFGGYASGAMLYAATIKKLPTLIHEQNSHAGITNKLLKNRVNKICVAYEKMEKYFPKNKLVITGNPIRKDLTENKINRTEAINFFKLDPNKKTVLIIGGSLGARTINQGILNNYQEILDAGYNIIWQKGNNFKQADDLQINNLYVSNFIYNMDAAYIAADVVISRAGALSIAELQVAKKPCILVPSPNVAEDHQTKNALALVNKNAAILVKDNEVSSKLTSILLNLLNNSNEQNLLISNIEQMAITNAAEKIVDEALNLINHA